MDYKVTVTNEIYIKLDEEFYNEKFIEDIKGYWGLDGYERKEVLEWTAQHIGTSVLQGCNIEEIEGIHGNADAHEVLQESKEIEVDEIEIR